MRVDASGLSPLDATRDEEVRAPLLPTVPSPLSPRAHLAPPVHALASPASQAVRRVVQDAFEGRDRGWSPETRARVARHLRLGENADPTLDALFASAVALVRVRARPDQTSFRPTLRRDHQPRPTPHPASLQSRRAHSPHTHSPQQATLRGDDVTFAAFAAVAPLAASAASAAATRWRDDAARAPVPSAPRLVDVDWSVRARPSGANDVGAKRATATLSLTVESVETRARRDGRSPPTERVVVELDARELAAVVESLAGAREQLAVAAGRLT